MRSGIRTQQSLMAEEQRSQFITKTYLHLFAAVMAFMCVEYFLLRSEAAQNLAMSALQHNWLIILGIYMAVSWGASFMARSASRGVQYAGLGLYVLAEAAIFLPLLMMAMFKTGDASLIFKSCMVTLSGFIALTGIAFVTRKNFSFLRGALMWGGILAMIAIVGGVLMGFSLGLWFSVLMVGLAGASILYTTSNIIHEYSEEDYVGASLELFSALALMLWYVVRIFTSLSDD